MSARTARASPRSFKASPISYGFGREGGSWSFTQETTSSLRSISPLSKALQMDIARDGYGGVSLHEGSHGESFVALLTHRFRRKGFYILDEPEAALSPQRQLTMLAIMRDLPHKNDEIQLLIATHSSILLAYPGAQIFSFDDGVIHQTTYRETSSYQVVARFVARPEVFIREIFDGNPCDAVGKGD